jgi:hypothetical protein
MCHVESRAEPGGDAPARSAERRWPPCDPVRWSRAPAGAPEGNAALSATVLSVGLAACEDLMASSCSSRAGYRAACVRGIELRYWQTGGGPAIELLRPGFRRQPREYLRGRAPPLLWLVDLRPAGPSGEAPPLPAPVQKQTSASYCRSEGAATTVRQRYPADRLRQQKTTRILDEKRVRHNARSRLGKPVPSSGAPARPCAPGACGRKRGRLGPLRPTRRSRGPASPRPRPPG